MKPKKPTVEELEAQLKAIEEAKKKRHAFLMSMGVYVALIVGVLGSLTVSFSEDLTAAFKPIALGQLAGAVFVAGLLYNKLEEDRGKAQITGKNAFRMLRTALYHGYFWMSVIGGVMAPIINAVSK